MQSYGMTLMLKDDEEIARRYREWVDIFEKARAK